MGRLIGVERRRYYCPGLYEAWKQMYEEDLERLEKLREEKEKSLEDKISEAIRNAVREVRKNEPIQVNH